MAKMVIKSLGAVGEWIDPSDSLPPTSESVLAWIRWADGTEYYTDTWYWHEKSTWSMGSAEGYTVIAWTAVNPPVSQRGAP